ncbi:MAG: orotidine-5'-phosphate decarboxylase [Planctomycetota bacterium]|jgi:orotidine-5'-phosphate decarboxylase|nr:orotidine-5'-phosphate decarboxylase [Planctomycetota bacterium]
MKFIDRLHSAIDRCQNPAMVGLDPRLEHLPEPFRSQASSSASAAAALIEYHRLLIDVLESKVAIVKPQSAFFERLGHHGILALEDACAYAKEKNILVLMDAKRGDIGSTSEAYADTYLNGGHANAFPECDALTVNPYLGVDACQPFVDAAAKNGRGLYFLVKTSNPGAATFQDHGSPSLAEVVANQVNKWAQNHMGSGCWSNIGAVVGATRPEELANFRELMPNSPILLPGFGFQGGTADGLDAAFDSNGHGAVINSSRGILFAHQREDLQHLSCWEDKTAAAVDEMIEQLKLMGKN